MKWHRLVLAGSLLVLSGFVSFVSACSSEGSTSTPPDTDAGSAGLAIGKGPCTVDTQCAPNARGAVACFIGGQGGGQGDGGSSDGGLSYCSFRCGDAGPNTDLCGAPFLGTCNMRGYCKLQ